MAAGEEKGHQIGLVVAAHGQLAQALAQTSSAILGRPSGVHPFELNDGEEPQATAKRLKGLAKKVNRGRGVIILVDLMGGSPAAMALSLLDQPELEVISGVNLPMVLTAASLPPQVELEEATRLVLAVGVKAIQAAGPLLKS